MTNRNMKRRQRKQRKQILLVVCLMLVVCMVSVGGTIAWLTASTEQIVNTFTPTEISVTLTETTPTDKDNIPLIPGKVITKNPTVTANGSEGMPYYVFVEITEKNGLDDYLSYTIGTGWTAVPNVTNVYYKLVQNGGALAATPVLQNNRVTVNNLTAEEMAKITTNPSLSFKAYAIQKDGFTTVQAAWTEVSK